jgi:predicted DNA-binding transcriptional regulator YafY
MYNQYKMYRCIKLIEFLQFKERHIHTMAKYLNVSNRTVYRYLDLYKSLGYQVVKVNNKFKLIK